MERPARKLIKAGPGVRLNCIDQGPADGRPVLFVPGWEMNYEFYKPQVGFLATHGFRIVVPKMRGHMESNPARVKGGFSLERLTH